MPAARQTETPAVEAAAGAADDRAAPSTPTSTAPCSVSTPRWAARANWSRKRAACWCSRQCFRPASWSARSTAKARCASAAATVGYYSTTSGSFGLQAGAQSKALIFLFMTQDALEQIPQLRRLVGRRGCIGGAREDGRERRDRHHHRHQAGRGVRADQRRPDGRRLAARHEGVAPD